MNNIVILDSEICQAKRLVVEDYEGKLLFGNILVIDASGYVNSLRKRRDGHVFFGPVAEYVSLLIKDFTTFIIERLCYKRFHRKLQQGFVQDSTFCNFL